MAQQTKPVSAATRAKQQAIDLQVSALQAEHYRVTLMHSTDPDKPTINIGKGKGPDGAEKFYNADAIKRLIPYLSAQNANGYNIYITPIDSERHYLVVDDLNIDTVRHFWNWGYRPALIQNSSAESLQAVSILPKALVSHGAGNVLFKRLNRLIGDEKISGFIHPFRLAGFGNKKPSRQVNGKSPFVTVIHARHCVDDKATKEAQALDEGLNEDARQAKALPPLGVPITREHAGDIDIAAHRSWYQRRLDYWQDSADLSRIDRHLALRLRGQGYGENAAQHIIRTVSPDIATRHPRIDAYLQSKTADLYQPPAEPTPEPPRPASAGVPTLKPR